jgi:hypothetical protein
MEKRQQAGALHTLREVRKCGRAIGREAYRVRLLATAFPEATALLKTL